MLEEEELQNPNPLPPGTDSPTNQHAGGTMSETKSTVMHSAGNSDVVASHVVNDVIATTMLPNVAVPSAITEPKMSSPKPVVAVGSETLLGEVDNKNQELLESGDICNMMCSNQDEFMEHVAVPSAITEPKMSPPKPVVAVASETLVGELDNKNQELLESGDICNMMCSNQDEFTEHVAVPSAITEPKMSSPKPVVAVGSETLLGEVDNKNQELLESGDICNMMCSNQDEFMEHVAVPSAITEPKMSPPKPVVAVASETLVGELDNKNQELLESGDICNMMCSNQDEFTEHVAVPSAITEPKMSPPKPVVAVASETLVGELDNKNQELLESGDICNMMCSNQDEFTEHVAVPSAITEPKMSPTKPVIAVASETLVGELDDKNQELLESGDIWNMMCSNQDEFMEHVAVPSAITEPKMSPPKPVVAVASETLVGELDDNKNQGLLESGDICNMMCSNQDEFMEHVASEKHSAKLADTNGLKNATSECGSKSSSVTKPATFQCEVCKIRCNSNENLNSHFSGKKHLKKLKQSEEIPDPSLTPVVSLDQPESSEGKTVELHQGKPLSCDLCGIACNSYDMLKKHISGKQHQKNLEKSLKPIGPNLAPAMEPVATAQGMIGPFQDEGKMVEGDGSNSKAKRKRRHEDVEKKKQKLLQGGASNALSRCTLCNVVCTSSDGLISHFAGKKHLKLALKQAETQST
ncbi:Zinc finger, C2H2-like protein [Artemisia annua]|uniref:Zinc finger, C2H2-like protein n=1 Tax=Artemisia annua TaxID=35608 RepID=A0A2U1QH28_ARTAN|nr:Zinc finger, C2H2-like protein [Artemisia annua]